MSSLLSYFYTSVQEDLKFGEEDLIDIDKDVNKLKTIPEDREVTDFDDESEDSSEDDYLRDEEIESYLDEEERFHNDENNTFEDEDDEKSTSDRRKVFVKIVKSELDYISNSKSRPMKGMLTMRLMSYVYNTFFNDEKLLNYFKNENRFLDVVIKKTEEFDSDISENLNYEIDRRMSKEVTDELWRINVKLRNLLE